VSGITLFIDRDIWSHRLDAALRAAGIPFVAHRDHFPDDTPDAEWIAAVAERGWTILTRDRRIRYRANEAAAVRKGRLHMFALTSGNVSAAETATIVVKAWPAIQRAVATTPPPMMWSITRGGGVSPIKR
jgi:predicted nuclease of predicted toxin-antitoxin system